MQSKAKTVEAYLKSLPADRRAALEAVRKVILANLDKGIEEGMSYGMIGYYLPHSLYPAGYHCDPKMPLPYAGLASQKQYMSLYLCTTYYGADGRDLPEYTAWFKKAWAASGKKLDMGKVCIRFKRLEDIPLDVVGEAIRRAPIKMFVASYEAALAKNAVEAAKRSAARRAGKAPARKASSSRSRKQGPKARAKAR